MTIGSVVDLRLRGGLRRAQTTERVSVRKHRSLLRRIVGAVSITLLAAVLGIGGYLGLTLYQIDHAVHHIHIPASLLAKGRNDLLTVVAGPNHTEQVYVFHTTSHGTKVLKVPAMLELSASDGTERTLASFSVDAPTDIIAGLRQAGIPVGRYVGVDLHAVSPTSRLAELASGKLSLTSLISNPASTASLLDAVAKHIYLGPHTPFSSLLTLMHLQVGTPMAVPTSSDGSGHVVLASSASDVLRKFL
jgi:hypothetical protein